jgi:CBS domain-containing protein
MIGAVLAAAGAVVFFVTGGTVEGLWLVVVGAFLSTLATAARRGARLAARLGGEPAGTWARPFAGTLHPEALVHALPDGGPYAVEREGRLAGVLTHRGVAVASAATTARDVMVPWTSRLAFPAAESVRRALEHLQTEQSGVLVIVDEGGAAIGILDHAGVRARLGGRR